MKITFVRHTSVDVPPMTCYGQTDVPLKDSFPQEADAVRKQLEGRVFEAVFTSPLTRCVRLAEYCGYPDAMRDDRLKELDFGEWEMKRYDEIDDPRLREWYDDYINVRATGGESFADQGRRLAEFLESLRERGGENVLVFAHGGILMQAMLLSGDVAAEELFSHQPPYGGIIEMEI